MFIVLIYYRFIGVLKLVKKVSKTKQANTYALAWLEASKNVKLSKDVFNEVQKLYDSVKSDEILWKSFASQEFDNNKQILIISDLAKNLKLSDISTNALKIIASNSRLDILDLILKEFISLYYKDNNIIEVNVCSAVKLSLQQNKKLKTALEKKLNSKIILNCEIKPEILGGLKISYNSFLIDDTLQTKLSNIKKLIMSE